MVHSQKNINKLYHCLLCRKEIHIHLKFLKKVGTLCKKYHLARNVEIRHFFPFKEEQDHRVHSDPPENHLHSEVRFGI